MSREPAACGAAIEALLKASGLDPATNPDLGETPARVARLWRGGVPGRATTWIPAKILGDPVEGEADPDVVVVGGLRFHAMCPHHLLPYRGVAHVAYLPAGKLVGFGRLAELVDCFTKRLTLQERATHQIADALCRHLGARGAGCVIEAEQLCLALPGREARSVGRRDQRLRGRDARAPRSEDAAARGREAGRPGEVTPGGQDRGRHRRVARHRARRRGGAGGRGRARGGLRAQPRRGQRPVSLRRRARRRRGALRRRRARPARSARRAGQQRGHRRARAASTRCRSRPGTPSSTRTSRGPSW